MIVTNGVEFTLNIGGGCDASTGGKAPKQTAENCDPVFDNEVGESSATRLIADAIIRRHFHPEIAWKGTPVDFARICAVASTAAAMLFLLAVAVGLIAP